MQAPVFRELYSEKRVVAEERKSRIDNSPMGRFQETFLSSAISNNYRRPIIGYEQDVAALGRREVEAFFRERYGPRNLVITIVGDTTPEKVQPAHSRHHQSGFLLHAFRGLQVRVTFVSTCAVQGGQARCIILHLMDTLQWFPVYQRCKARKAMRDALRYTGCNTTCDFACIG